MKNQTLSTRNNVLTLIILYLFLREKSNLSTRPFWQAAATVLAKTIPITGGKTIWLSPLRNGITSITIPNWNISVLFFHHYAIKFPCRYKCDGIGVHLWQNPSNHTIKPMPVHPNIVFVQVKRKFRCIKQQKRELPFESSLLFKGWFRWGSNPRPTA